MSSYELGDPGAYLLAFEEGRRAVLEQAEVLKDTRDRVGALLSAAVVSASLAAGLATGRGNPITDLGTAGIALAGVGFLVIAVAGVAIWLPLSGTFAFDAGVLVGSYADGPSPATLPEMHRELALHLGRHGQANRVRLDTRLRWFSSALIGFLIEAIGLLLLLTDIAG